MRIGIVCYPSVGGSGAVATELGKWLARRGHQVHFISSGVPFRLNSFSENIFFHIVETPQYPLLRDSQYFLSLANKIVEVARFEQLEVIHAHYAIPHAASAFLAKSILGHALPVVTTLHGTDITLLGSDPSFAETIAFCINQSDAVTAVSESLRRTTLEQLPVSKEIEVIPNFVDLREYRRMEDACEKFRLAGEGEGVVIHASNFRAIKRPDLVVRVFAKVAERVPARLLMVGDGPELGRTHQLVNELGLRRLVRFLGAQESMPCLLSLSDAFLLPSQNEAFGLAALEAMACEVPVVASRIGGLPELITNGETGYLVDAEDVDGMAERLAAILSDGDLRARLAQNARRQAETHYDIDLVAPRYESVYRKLLQGALAD